jgi:hypothetical protein
MGPQQAKQTAVAGRRHGAEAASSYTTAVSAMLSRTEQHATWRKTNPGAKSQVAGRQTATKIPQIQYSAPVVGIEFTIERERSLVPVVETNCWELRPCFSS